MKNRYVSVKCPSCMITIQMKAKSLRSDIFFCPVCEYGEIEMRGTLPLTHHSDSRLPVEVRVPITF